MSIFQLEIALKGEAFSPDPGPELIRLVRSVADKLEADPLASSSGGVKDLNGNRCGSWWIESEERDDA